METPWLEIDGESAGITLKLDGKALIGALFGFAKTVVTRKPEELISNAGEAFKALGLKPDPERLAGFLMQRAMSRALEEVIEENRYRFAKPLPEEKQVMDYFAKK